MHVSTSGLVYSEDASCETDYFPPMMEPWTVDPNNIGNCQVYVDSLLKAGISNKLSPDPSPPEL